MKKPVDRTILQDILEDAHRAPSSSNQQPWIFHVVSGTRLTELCARIAEARRQDNRHYDPSRGKTIPSEYVQRTKTLFRSLKPLIQSLGEENRSFIESGSFRFYDAPTVIFISMHRQLPKSRLMDIGMAAQNIMLSAHERGLGTCAIALTLLYADCIQKFLEISDEIEPALSLAIGYPDEDFVINTFRSSRDDLADFVTWIDDRS